MSVNDIVKTNEEQEKELYNFYIEEFYRPTMDNFSKLLFGIIRQYVDLRMQGSFIHSFAGYLLLNMGGEFVIDYDKYEELTKQLVDYGPFKVHGYVKDDGKFHIWMEKNDEPESENSKT